MPTSKQTVPPEGGKTDFQKFVSRLENMILTGAFKLRERLVEATLAEKFGVSRYWVRDAFKILETKELVTITPFKGVMVSELSEQKVEEIFVIRVALEQLAARLSLEKATAEQIKTLRMMVEKIKAASYEKNIVAMIEADSNFHDYLFLLSGNLTLRRMINNLRNRSQIIRYAAWSSPDVLNRIFEEHERIVDAIESRDMTQMNSLVEKHIGHAKEVYLFRLKAETALLA
jgi:DNA-binding GntR family transcriptional regulator